ncbi:MAG: DsbA family protein [Schleiferiaceae bacterium]|nr:DsbA family protein [Schleiferiaceae bacterium]
MMASDIPVVYYVFDALCGWCYGFSPVMETFYEKHREDPLEFRVLSGGMVLGEREGPIGEVAGYIKEAYKEVEKNTGVAFGQAFLDNILAPGTARFTSLPAALAMAAFRRYQPDNAIPFAARIQKAIYAEGKPPAEASTFGECAEDFGMQSAAFMKLMVDKELLELVRREFKVVQEWGIRGFPAVIYQAGEQGYLLAQGYTDEAGLEENLKMAREKAH